MPPDEPINEARIEVRSYARRFLSLGLQFLSLVVWGLCQIGLVQVHRFLPDDLLTQVAFYASLSVEAVYSLGWTGLHAFRELRIFLIRVQTDIQLEQHAARQRLERAARQPPRLPERPEE